MPNRNKRKKLTKSQSHTPPPQRTSCEPKPKKAKTIPDGKNATEALGDLLSVNSQPAQVVLRGHELKAAQKHVKTMEGIMGDLHAVVTAAVAAAVEPLQDELKGFKEELQDQLNGHTEELKYLRHMDDMRIYRQAAVNVRDWVRARLKQKRSRQQSRLEFLKDMVESPKTFWKDLTEFIDYAHRVMHLGYKADGHITPNNIQGIASRILEFNREHCSGPLLST